MLFCQLMLFLVSACTLDTCQAGQCFEHSASINTGKSSMRAIDRGQAKSIVMNTTQLTGIKRAAHEKDEIAARGPHATTKIDTVNTKEAAAGHSFEKLSGVKFNGSELTFTVISTGCTSAKNFSVSVHEEKLACRISVTRDTADLCKRAPEPVEISIAMTIPDSCEGLPLILSNPILVLDDVYGLKKRFVEQPEVK